MRFIIVFCAVIASLSPACAQRIFPERPIRILIAQNAGSTADLAMRVVAQKLTEMYRYEIVVINGGLGEVVKRECALATADGYTLCIVNDGQAATIPATYLAAKQEPPARDLVPIGLIGDQYFALLTRHDRPSTYSGLLAYAQKNPDELLCGAGNISGIIGIAVMKSSGAKIREVRYLREGEPRVHMDMRGQTLDCMFSSTVTAMPHILDGAVHVVGTLGPYKNPFLPHVRPLSDFGNAMFDRFPSWIALWGPPNLPAHIRDALNMRFAAVLGQKDVIEGLARTGVSARTLAPSELNRLTHDQTLATLQIMCEQRVELNGRVCAK